MRRESRALWNKTIFIITYGGIMKQPKKLKRDHKKLLDKAGLVPDEWMCLTEDSEYLHIIKKDLSDRKIISKRKGEVLSNEH